MPERRKSQRFNIHCQVLMQTNNGSVHPIRQLWTRDISVYGAFLETDQPEEPGTLVNLDLFLNIHAPAGRTIRAKGKVVRREENGIAVRFDWSGFREMH